MVISRQKPRYLPQCTQMQRTRSQQRDDHRILLCQPSRLQAQVSLRFTHPQLLDQELEHGRVSTLSVQPARLDLPEIHDQARDSFWSAAVSRCTRAINSVSEQPLTSLLQALSVLTMGRPKQAS